MEILVMLRVKYKSRAERLTQFLFNYIKTNRPGKGGEDSFCDFG